MAKHQTIESIEIIDKTGSTKALFVPEYGGMISSIQMGDRELLYLHDTFWQKEVTDLRGGFPFCFPVVARLKRQEKKGVYLYDGKQYELPIHGFSWFEPWSVENQSRDQLTLILRDNERTQKMYPFKFEIKLRYEITHNKLICHQSYVNLSDKPMPYYAGFHPYFQVAKPGAGKSEVTFNYHPTRRFVYNSDYTDIVGETSLFALPAKITDPNVNEQLTRVGENKEATLHYRSGDVLHMVAEGVEDPDLFPYIQLYTIPDEPFFCIEPWMSYPNAMNSVQGVRWLAPGQSEHGLFKLWLETARG